MKPKYIHQNCDKILANDKTLPSDSYLVSYFDEENNVFYDIVRGVTRVEIFDHYYDMGIQLKSIDFTKGVIRPNLWNNNSKDEKKK